MQCKCSVARRVSIADTFQILAIRDSPLAALYFCKRTKELALRCGLDHHRLESALSKAKAEDFKLADSTDLLQAGPRSRELGTSI